MARSVADLRLLFEVCRVRGHNYPMSEAALNDPSRQIIGERPVAGRRRARSEDGIRDSGRRARPRRCGEQAFGLRVCEFLVTLCRRCSTRRTKSHDRIYRRALAYYFDLEWNADASLFSDIMREMIDGGLASHASPVPGRCRHADASCRNLSTASARNSTC